ncbi:uncharacterized protein LOC144440206 [Glandiceps talaboti]
MRKNIKVMKLCALWSLIFCVSTFVFYDYSLDMRYKFFVAWFGFDNVILGGTGWINGTLQPHDDYVIPNTAHFVWFNCRPFTVIHMLSLASVYQVMKPDKIFFYTDCEPEGEYWNQVSLIPQLEVKYMKGPTEVGGKPLNKNWPEHMSDIARLRILLREGGVYFDTDIFVVNPLDPLRKYDYVAGREDGYLLSGAVMMASKDSQFLKEFYKSYEETYRDYCYNCNAIVDHHNLAEKFPHLIHIENYSMHRPDNINWKTLFYRKFDWQNGHYTFHIWKDSLKLWSWIGAPRQKDGNYIREFNLQNIRELDSAFGEMSRFIYYGTKDIIPLNIDPPEPWWTELKKRKSESKIKIDG